MNDDEPTVNVKYSVFNKLREDQRTTQNRVYELEKELAAAKLTDGSGAAQLLHDAFHEAIKVVQFAVGNLAPETVAGWPYKALFAIADAIEKIPGVDVHVREMPAELRHFAKLCAGYEEYRKQRDANRVVTAATAADFGPKTPEAAVVHAVHTAPSPSAENIAPQPVADEGVPTQTQT